jgi:hypothetical protein
MECINLNCRCNVMGTMYILTYSRKFVRNKSQIVHRNLLNLSRCIQLNFLEIFVEAALK